MKNLNFNKENQTFCHRFTQLYSWYQFCGYFMVMCFYTKRQECQMEIKCKNSALFVGTLTNFLFNEMNLFALSCIWSHSYLHLVLQLTFYSSNEGKTILKPLENQYNMYLEFLRHRNILPNIFYTPTDCKSSASITTKSFSVN